MCPFAGVGCFFKGSPQSIQEHEATSQASHLHLMLGRLKEWKSLPGSNLGSTPMALERNLSELQLQAAVEATGDLEVDCYRAPCCESQDEQALWHLLKEKQLAQLEEKLRVFENIVAVLNKEVEASHLALAASIHQSQLDRELILSLEQRVVELQQTLAQKDQVLGKLEQSLRLMEEASFDGTFLWKITNVTRRCHESMCGRTASLFSPDLGSKGANSQLLEIKMLNEVMAKQRAEITRLRDVLNLTGTGDKGGGIENVLEEIAELRHEVSAQNEYISSMTDPFRRQGYWCFIPPPPPSSKGQSAFLRLALFPYNALQSTRTQGLPSTIPSPNAVDTSILVPPVVASGRGTACLLRCSVGNLSSQTRRQEGGPQPGSLAPVAERAQKRQEWREVSPPRPPAPCRGRGDHKPRPHQAAPLGNWHNTTRWLRCRGAPEGKYPSVSVSPLPRGCPSRS
ncbi:TNF receptor-associated factor 1 [Cricetulus griseus]